MRKVLILAIVVALSFAVVGSTGVSADMFVYPAKGQSEQQQEQDKWECHQWAVKQTGVNPQALANQATSLEAYRQPEGGFGRAAFGGAARGAAVGAIGGAIGGDAGKGTEIGAAVGGITSIFRARRRMEEQQQYNQAVAQRQNAAMANYDKAYATCLRGRGYTVG